MKDGHCTREDVMTAALCLGRMSLALSTMSSGAGEQRAKAQTAFAAAYEACPQWVGTLGEDTVEDHAVSSIADAAHGLRDRLIEIEDRGWMDDYRREML